MLKVVLTISTILVFSLIVTCIGVAAHFLAKLW
jgi:hypothetical protein